MTATTMIVMTTLTFFVKTILTKKLWFVKPEISLSVGYIGTWFVRKVMSVSRLKKKLLNRSVQQIKRFQSRLQASKALR